MFAPRPPHVAEAPGGPRIPGMPGGSRKSTGNRRIQGIAIPKRAAQAFPLPNGLSLIHKKLWNSFCRDVSEPEGKGFSRWVGSLFGMGGCASQKTEREFRSSFPNSGFGEQELRLGREAVLGTSSLGNSRNQAPLPGFWITLWDVFPASIKIGILNPPQIRFPEHQAQALLPPFPPDLWDLGIGQPGRGRGP